MANLKEINFYKLKDFDKSFPKLLETIIAKDNKVMVYSSSNEQLTEVDERLWSYAQLSFLPHLCKGDAMAAHSPIYLTTDLSDNKNGANIVAIIDESTPNDLNFEKLLLFYNDDNKYIYQEYAAKMQDVKCNFISQTQSGTWQRDGNL